MALGVIFGLSCSLMLKHSELGESALAQLWNTIVGRDGVVSYEKLVSWLILLRCVVQADTPRSKRASSS